MLPDASRRIRTRVAALGGPGSSRAPPVELAALLGWHAARPAGKPRAACVCAATGAMPGSSRRTRRFVSWRIQARSLGSTSPRTPGSRLPRSASISCSVTDNPMTRARVNFCQNCTTAPRRLRGWLPTRGSGRSIESFGLRGSVATGAQSRGARSLRASEPQPSPLGSLVARSFVYWPEVVGLMRSVFVGSGARPTPSRSRCSPDGRGVCDES